MRQNALNEWGLTSAQLICSSESREDSPKERWSLKQSQIIDSYAARDLFSQLMGLTNPRLLKTQPNRERPNAWRKSKQVLMQKNSIGNNQITDIWLVEPRNLCISPSVLKKVLRVPDYFLDSFGEFLNPLPHMRLMMILPDKPLQDALSSGGQGMNRNRVTIIEPKIDRGVKLASSNQLFSYSNRCRWIVWHADLSSYRSLPTRTSPKLVAQHTTRKQRDSLQRNRAEE
jgi:hypothetical protein